MLSSITFFGLTSLTALFSSILSIKILFLPVHLTFFCLQISFSCLTDSFCNFSFKVNFSVYFSDSSFIFIFLRNFINICFNYGIINIRHNYIYKLKIIFKNHF
jgi:hypothetical protein